MSDPFSQEFWAENNDLGDIDLGGAEVGGAGFGTVDPERPPICASCGVTMLPADAFGSGFSCQNDDCEAADDA